MAGRGFGKTRTGAESIRLWVDTGKCRNIALISDNILNAQHVMVEGVSGILNCYPPDERPVFERSKNRIVWKNGAVAELFSSEAYENLRGPQFDGAWVDELAKFKNAQETWDQLMFGLRLGVNPQCIVTTTPKPLPLLTKLMKRSDVIVTHGSTFDNADNLSESFINNMKQHYMGSRIAEQELMGHYLRDQHKGLWGPHIIHYNQPTGIIL